MRPSSYVLSLIISDAPRAIWHSLLFFLCSYWIVGLNPGAAYMAYTIAVTMLGAVCFQSAICLCSCMTDEVGLAYTYMFFILACSGVFGGLCITYDNIRPIFKPLYYLALPAYAYRAIIINDLACCHRDISCKDAYEMFSTSDFKGVRNMAPDLYDSCAQGPKGADGTYPLGQYALITSQLAPHGVPDYIHYKTQSVAVLLFFAVFLRWAATVALRRRAAADSSMVVVREADIRNQMRQVGAVEPGDVDLAGTDDVVFVSAK